jgi:diguanylate cyclase
MQAAEKVWAKVQGPLEPDAASQAVMASMRENGIRFTAANYAVWHGYLTGANPAVTRAIDIVLSNGKAIDETSLLRLYTRHFCPEQRALYLRDIAQICIEQFNDMREILRGGADRQAAAACLDRLDRKMQAFATENHALQQYLALSRERTDLLESFLHDATRDATTDALTGLSNRRAFDAALRNAAGEAMNSGCDLAFVLLDIDHFKLVNDRWGHPAGDEVLRLVAATLTRTVRGGDLVARYGGEEFAMILPETGHRGALAVAENVREAVARQSLAYALDTGADTGLGGLKVTVSAGISCYIPGESLGDWLSRADVALYCAKHAGRNRVIFGTGSQMPAANGAPGALALPA